MRIPLTSDLYLKVSSSRWPWQKQVGTAPLNQSGARFGGGWRYKLGISIGSTTVLLDLIWGIVRFTLGRHSKDREYEEARTLLAQRIRESRSDYDFKAPF